MVAGGDIFAVVGGDVDDTAGLGESEVVGGGFVGKAHGVVAADSDCIVMGWVMSWVWCRGWLLG